MHHPLLRRRRKPLTFHEIIDTNIEVVKKKRSLSSKKQEYEDPKALSPQVPSRSGIQRLPSFSFLPAIPICIPPPQVFNASSTREFSE